MKHIEIFQFLSSILAVCLIENAKAIVGGRYAKESQFGYHVSLEISGKNVCGGAIINGKFVITAANCIIDSTNCLKSSSINVIAGVNDLRSTSLQKLSIGVQEVFLPVVYNSADELPIGDIALLKLKNGWTIDKNPNLSQLQISQNDIKYDDVEATFTGFGWNVIKYIHWPEINIIEETGGSGDEKLRYAKTFVISNEQAQRWEKYQLDSKHLCAYVEQNDRDTATGACTGDVGGPLVYNNTLIGILSKRRDGCREDEQTAIYTRVSSYAEFISKIINEKSISDVRHLILD